MFLIFEEPLYLYQRIRHKRSLRVLKNEKKWLMNF